MSSENQTLPWRDDRNVSHDIVLSLRAKAAKKRQAKLHVKNCEDGNQKGKDSRYKKASLPHQIGIDKAGKEYI
jgi:hypothetical protein